jgi:hypothetical protein
MLVFDGAVLRCHQEFDCKYEDSFLYSIYGANTGLAVRGEEEGWEWGWRWWTDLQQRFS